MSEKNLYSALPPENHSNSQCKIINTLKLNAKKEQQKAGIFQVLTIKRVSWMNCMFSLLLNIFGTFRLTN